MLAIGILILCKIPVIEMSVAQAKLYVISSPIITALTLALGTIRYKITDEHVRLNITFLDILGGRIRIDNILNIVIKNNKLYISYIWQGNDPVISEIMISPKQFDSFKDILIAKNNRIVYFNDDNDTIQ